MKWCSCIEWEDGWPVVYAQQKAGERAGILLNICMPFCPWCGSDLEDV